MKFLPFIIAVASVIPAAAEIPPPGDIMPDTEEHPGKKFTLTRDCEAFTLEAMEAIRERSYGSIVEMTEADDGFIYFKYMISEYPCESNIKAERVGDQIRIKGPQALYVEYNYDTEQEYTTYLVPLIQHINENQQGYYLADENLEFLFNVEADGTLVSADPTVILGVCTYGYAHYLEDYGYIWMGYGDRDITISKVKSQPVVPPTNITPEAWVFDDEYDTALINIIFDNNDVYVQGLDRNLPDAWAKGEKTSDDQIEFKSGQYMGPDFADLFYHYLCGAEFMEVEVPDMDEPQIQAKLAPAAIFRYDAENQKMHTVNGYVINSSADELYPLYFYEEVRIEVQHRDPDCPPLAPYNLVYTEDEDMGNSLWFQVPNVDTDGNLLLDSNLYYEIFLDGDAYEPDIEYPGIEDHPTWIPYLYEDYEIYVAGRDHTVYVTAEGAETQGVRSIYVNENGKVLYSDMCELSSRVENVEMDVEKIEWHDLTGRPLSNPGKGITIRTIKYSDGSVKTNKMLNK